MVLWEISKREGGIISTVFSSAVFFDGGNLKQIDNKKGPRGVRGHAPLGKF